MNSLIKLKSGLTAKTVLLYFMNSKKGLQYMHMENAADNE